MGFDRKEYQRQYMKKYRSKKSPGKSSKTTAVAKKVSVKNTPVKHTSKPFCYVTNKGKTVRQQQLDAFALKSSDSKQIKDRFSASYSKGLVQPVLSPDTFNQLLEVNTFHARCCEAKARDTAGLGFLLKANVDNPNKSIGDEINEFFNNQSPPITILLSRMQKDYEAVGYGALEMTRVGNVPSGKPNKLHHIPAHTIRIHESGNKFCQIRGSKKVWFKLINYEKDVDCKTGEESELGTLSPERRATEVLWNSDYSSRSDYYGLPCIFPAIGTVYGDISRRDYNISFFSNYGVPAYAVFITGNFDLGDVDSDGKTDLENSIEEHFKNLADYPHSTLVMTIPTNGSANDVKVDIKPLSVDIKEASFRLYRKDNRDEVIIAHGVPAYRIGVVEGGSLGGNFAKEATEIYKASIIEPRQIVVEQLFNQEVIWHENGFDTKDYSFELAEIDTKDEAHEKDMVAFLFEHGAITIRGIIQLYSDKYGLEEDDDPIMDVRFVKGTPMSGDFVNVGDLQNGLKNFKARLLDRAIKNSGSDDIIGIIEGAVDAGN